jgi:hypothetical protein
MSDYSNIISISTAILPKIPRHNTDATIVGRFQNAINVRVGHTLLAFVLPILSNGPFHIITNRLPDKTPTTSLTLKWEKKVLNNALNNAVPNVLCLGDWHFIITPQTQYWESKPSWENIHLDEAQIILLCRIARSLISHKTTGNVHTKEDILQLLTPSRIEKLWQNLKTANYSAFLQVARDIIGRGPGLTPTGDDFLAGMMLSLWALHHPNTESICWGIVDVAQQRTTEISIAYITAMAEGNIDEKWHHLFSALADNNRQLLENIIDNILSFGATSGSDMLWGFLWGIQFQRPSHKIEFDMNWRSF